MYAKIWSIQYEYQIKAKNGHIVQIVLNLNTTSQQYEHLIRLG